MWGHLFHRGSRREDVRFNTGITICLKTEVLVQLKGSFFHSFKGYQHEADPSAAPKRCYYLIPAKTIASAFLLRQIMYVFKDLHKMHCF